MSEREAVVALIPIREGSQRVKDKNFRPFGEQPTLLHYKLVQLKEAGCFDHVYVSSDSERAARIAKECLWTPSVKDGTDMAVKEALHLNTNVLLST